MSLHRPPEQRPLHRQPACLVLVLVGGMAGSLARWGVGQALPVTDGWPTATLLVNLTGAFLLGLLLTALRRRGPDVGPRRVARLLLGTGFLGSFTTMSALAVESLLLAEASGWALALVYLTVSLLGGVLAAWLGLLAGLRVAPGGTGG